ncbi:MAG: sugar phosphate nucleotidyltransferase [Candidatus Pelagibacter bacterium]|jgi:UTP--glucose-1-phosphate uridylyltransferase|nr:UTP--glucose-1-phosphate uridylyltransferase [Candidatus Pelagibacter bacterium]MDF1857799.1 sugar phosphate nucleotidyltransferase [Candidatus Pelagibacter bacterium]|tara:strand:- start:131 stop:946 length:816 start_codon:yes stop_codon:yes gene_type:complete
MIKQAIIPLAGLGTRLLPLTSVFAKELLPINGKPGIEYILDECINAGIKEVIFIISKKKLMIKNYFYNDKFYKDIIKKKKDQRIIKEYKKILKYKKMIKFVFQEKPLGTGDAVLKTKKFIKDKYFLMLLPDDLIMKSNCSKSMISIHKKYNSSVMASMKVNKKDVSRWGIYNIKKNIDKNNFIIKNVVEKPSIKSAPSKNAVIGRYILPKTIFKKLSKLKPGSGKEIHITDAIQSLIDENYRFIGHNFNGKYLDCGTMKGYINSTLEIAKI